MINAQRGLTASDSLAIVTLRDGLVDLSIPASVSSPAWAVRNARIGVQWAGEEPLFSPQWQLLATRTLLGEDRLGSYTGLSACFAVGNRLQVEWSATVYEQRSLAAVSMSVTNSSAQDQLLLRLCALHADPAAGAAIEMALDPARALILPLAAYGAPASQ